MLGIAFSTTNAAADYLEVSLGNWALGGSTNCKVAAKHYTLTTYSGNITWRTDTGDVDIESIVSGNEREFQTVTINSIHRSGRGNARGTAWTYTDGGPGFMQVSLGNGKAFILGRCW